METRVDNQLENLDAWTRGWLLDLAAHARRLNDLMEPLMEKGIRVSLPTLTRFVRRHREEMVVSEGEDMEGTVEALATRGQGEKFRKGTMEMLRQQLYEQALGVNSQEEGQALFGALLREEEKKKELDLAERRLALAEKQVEVQRLKAERGGGRKRVEVSSAPAAGAIEGEVTAEVNEEGTEKEKALKEVVLRLEGILNRGGPPAEKVLEARAVLGSERKLLAAAVEKSG